MLERLLTLTINAGGSGDYITAELAPEYLEAVDQGQALGILQPITEHDGKVTLGWQSLTKDGSKLLDILSKNAAIKQIVCAEANNWTTFDVGHALRLTEALLHLQDLGRPLDLRIAKRFATLHTPTPFPKILTRGMFTGLSLDDIAKTLPSQGQDVQPRGRGGR